jgi:subtilisin
VSTLIEDVVLDGRTSGRSLVLIRESLPTERALQIFRTMSPPDVEAPTAQEIGILPNGWIVGAIRAAPGELLSPPFRFSFFSRGVVVEAERVVYRVQPPVEAVTLAPGWHLEASGVGPNSPTGKGVTIAVLDSGLDRCHPDFRWRVPDEDFVSFIGGTADDNDDHGTHCAGVACGRGTTPSGSRYGVAPDARLIVGRVIDKQASPTLDMELILGMLWAHSRGADIISLSIGTPQRRCDPTSRIFDIVATVLLDHGTIIVGAVGNSTNRQRGIERPIHHPVDSPDILAVAALEADGNVCFCSCPSLCGQRDPALAAPGRDIYSAIPVGIDAATPYTAKTGTSSATALAAGLAALWVESSGKRGRALFDFLRDPANLAPLSGNARDVGCGRIKSP